MKKYFAFFFVLFLFAVNARADSGTEHKLQEVLESFLAQNPTVPGIMVTLDSDQLDLHWSGSAGVADLETKQPIAPDQPLRLASTTKTYVSAAVLRLMEQGKLNLDDTLDQHLPRHQLDVLKADAYQPEKISIRQVLTHTSGIYDFGQGGHKGYVEAVLADTKHRWTREEQLQFAMDEGAPIGEPGERFHYSDTGYILLGEIIERRSGLKLAPALRTLLKFSELGLDSTWLESLEPVPESVAPRVTQYMKEINMNGWDPSLDLWGGGGLVANMPDLAHFYKALFEGDIFEKPGTLENMKTTVATDLARPGWMANGKIAYLYSMGLFVTEYRDYSFFSHGGHWGTEGGYLPALGLAWGWAITQEDTWGGPRQKLLTTLLDVVMDYQKAVSQSVGVGVTND